VFRFQIKTYSHYIKIGMAFLFTIFISSQSVTAYAAVPDWAAISSEPFNLIPAPEVTNPVLTASDVTDVTARFVADPFILVDQGIWYMFFEVLNDVDGKGIIGMATSSDGLQWQYEQIVLTESVHLSYPLVLKHENEYYMIPESADLNEVRVYRATNFPYDWEYVSTIASGRAYVDPSIFFYNQKWWMFVGEVYSSEARGTCRLFYSDDLLGGWIEHPQSPIVIADTSKSRPAGRSFVFDNDRIIRLAQKNNVIYGQRVRAFEVDVLSETQYAEHEIVESPILYESGTGWNASGMHQFDPWWTGDRWLGAVDGNNNRVWSIGIYSANEVNSLPELNLSPSVMSFTAQAGGSTGSQTLSLTTSDGGSATYSITDNADWLSVTPTSGATPGTLTAVIDAAGLSVGTYTATVTAEAGGYASVTVPVTLTVSSASSSYDLQLSEVSNRSGAVLLNGTSVQGNIYVFVSPESGISRVSFYIDDPQMSGTPTKVEGIAPYDLGGTADATLLALPFNSASLSDGPHQMTARVELSTGGSQVVNASFTVANSVPQLQLAPTVLSFGVQAGGSTASQTLALTTSDGASASYTITDNATWLSVVPTSGNTPGTLTVSINAAGLSVGTYTATITAEASGYASATAPVTLTVTSASSSYDLQLSEVSNRSGAVLLNGTSVQGNIYVFVSPESGISRVSFYIDDPQMSGTPTKVEGIAPYDLGGTADATLLALPFNSASLSDGPHQMTARVELSTGGSQVVNASFTVANSVPQLQLAPTVLSFGVQAGGSTASQTLALTTSDGASASYTITDNATWLSVVPTSGNTPGTLTVSINAAGLSVGTYTATITAEAGGYASATAPVTLTVTSASSSYDLLLSDAPDRSGAVLLNGTSVQGNIYVFVSPESGISRVSFYIDDPQMSGTPTKVEGRVPYDLGGTADATLLALPFNSASLSDGPHQMTARVELSTGGSQVVNASFTVANSVAQLQLAPTVLSFGVQAGGSTASQTLALTTSDGASASYTITDNATWLSVVPTSGNTPGTLTVSINAAGLSVGTYTATITAEAGGYASVTVPVTLTVSSASSSYDLQLSEVSNRSGAVLLNGTSVQGNIYVFVSPESGISRVSFYIDDPQMSGTPTKVEGRAPYDLGGTADATLLALPFNSASLSDGPHQMTARVELSTGGSQVVNASFTVNNSITLPFYHDFNDGNANGWNVVDDSGYSSNWVIVNGEYRQQNFVGRTGSALQGNYHLGTYTFLQTGMGLTDYLITVDAIPLTGADVDLDVQGNDIGIMFRYRDNDNYYRFSLNANQGFSRLEKKSQGIFTTLAQDARGYLVGQWLTIDIEVQGPVIQVFLNGDPLFGAYDQSIPSGSIGLYCQDISTFDNVAIEEVTTEPSVTIAAPAAYSVGLTNGLSVSALATNLPAFGTIEFELDGVPCSEVTQVQAGLFQAQCLDIPQGEHTLEALMMEGATVSAVDTNMLVGTEGNYLVTIGDSITNGKGDNYFSDNISSDERVIAVQGYQAVLNDLLTATQSVPTIIYNEGVPGDESYDAAFERADAILERHSQASRALVLLGTNDAGSSLTVPSGLNLAASEGSFKYNMQVLIDKIRSTGMNVTVAYVPPVFNTDGSPNNAINPKIQEYNAVIAAADLFPLNGHQKGPDFYDFFFNQVGNGASLYADTGHPNGLGTRLVAHLWHNALVSETALPLYLADLSPVAYKQDLIELSDNCYLDNDWTVTQIPTSLNDGIWIKTANADRTDTSNTFISFVADRPVIVNVAYDAGAVLPEWLNPATSSFIDTGLQIGTTGGLLRVYSRTYSSSSNSVVLGGNRAGGGAGNINYLVIVQEQ
jgi:lysophospholipase L1-like esterase